MIKQIIEYRVLPDMEAPTLDDIKDAVAAAKEHHAIVELAWRIPYSAFQYEYVSENDDPQDVFDDRIPRIYPV